MDRRVVLDGKAHSALIVESVAARASALLREHSILPSLAVVSIGDSPSARAYAALKVRAGGRCGVRVEPIFLDRGIGTEEAVIALRGLNARSGVHGILLQYPLPPAFDARACFEAIAPEKDVDGACTASLGRLALGMETFAAAAAEGALRLLSRHRLPIAGKKALVLGREGGPGEACALLLMRAGASVALRSPEAADLAPLARGADIIFAAAGIQGFLRADWVREGCVLIDSGSHGGGVGDIEPAAFEKASAYAPVPGGIGPMTVALLLERTVECAERSAGE